MVCAAQDAPGPRSLEALTAALDHVRQSPPDDGRVELIVRRPDVDAREVLSEGWLSVDEGLVGDSWRRRPSSRTPDGHAHPDMQLNLMNARVIAAIAGPVKRWSLAGDQLFVDFDLRQANVPPGTRLGVGEAMIEVTDQPHTGCGKFAARFGVDALKWVNSPEGRTLGLRGINARVIRGGLVKLNDRIFRVGKKLG